MAIIKEALFGLKIANNINKCINEELGISNELRDAAIQISNDIILKLNSVEKEYIDSGVSKKMLHYKDSYFNRNIHINIEYYNFKNIEVYERYIKNNQLDSFSVSLDGRLNSIYIKFYSISGNINKEEMIDSIFHELEHLYQQIKRNKSFNDNKLYNFATANLYSSNINKKSLALIIYLSRKYEQDAFINGLYDYLKANEERIGATFEDIKGSEIYHKLIELKNTHDYLKSNIDNSDLNKEINFYKDNFNIDYKKFLLLCDNAIQSLYHKIGRTIIKFKNDMIKKGAYYSIPHGSDKSNIYNI